MSAKLLDPIRRSRISEQVANQIEELIRAQKLNLGDKLPSERQLMEMLGVGRGAVREALRILEIKGYVESRPGIGSFVKDFEGDIRLPFSLWLADRNEILANFFEVRLFLEPNAAALAAKRITPEQLRELAETHQAFCRKVADGDLTGSIKVDAEFHKLIAQATQNKLLAMTMETLNKSVIEGWKASLRAPGRADKTIREHASLLQAIENKDPHEAARLTREHLENAVADLKKSGLDIQE
ncbi:GntR family transcriptional regulator [Desulfuromonas versatilis]|uniref:GntR family transcriptional regulator n=1 Tax=Desulfuromonas versatilis TaxID=2802975 RepID=A0ABM8HPL2_9BACT|nr:FadR/GntR family transcriptional regulator [Desulfuromonas versatilis]BCR04900.1 GntR family transcriptional regulator [Desulfuromonas versatilis]